MVDPVNRLHGKKGQEPEAWIRVVGLPLHLWTGEILKKVGDSCGGFVALDEETALKTDLHWARILVKMNSSGKPSSVNLLAGARSYELQIWWEIQPTAAEVYPRKSRTSGAPAEPDEEDDRKARADGHVRTEWAVMSHTSREEQRDVGHLFLLETCAAADGLSQCQKRGVISKVGVKHSFEIQNNLRFSMREEELKKAHLRDTNRGSPGPYLECVVGQNPCPIQGVSEGQSLISFMEQIVRPTVRNSQAAHRGKGMLVEKTKGMVNSSCAVPQESEAIVVEERGFQEMIPTKMPDCSEDNKTKWGIEQRGEKHP